MVESKLKELIINRYGSIREFALCIEMPYSTVDTIFRRGIDKASISNVIRICKALEISVDGIAEGEIVKKVYGGLSPDETSLISVYRSSTSTGQQLLLTTAQAISGNPDMQKDAPGDPEALSS